MRRFARPLTVIALLLVPALVVFAQKPKKTVRRAEPPKFNEAEVKGIFFDNVFAEGGPLVGSRPSSFSAGSTVVKKPNGGGSGAPVASTSNSGWAAIISGTTIADEVKAIKLKVDSDVDKPSQFAGRGYKFCRTHFSILAMLFAITGEYDEDVRWKKDAPGVRDVFARTAANCKVGTIQVFNEAKLRKAELQDLIGGASLNVKEAAAKPDWAMVCDRSPLMKRLDTSMQARLQQWTANAGDFSKNAQSIKHEAEIVAAISEVLMKEGLEDAGDDDYDGFAKRMKDAAREIVDAVNLKDDEKARKAVGEINKACSECHESYRA